MVHALKAGARAYLLKGSVNNELLATIRAGHAGQKRIPAEGASGLAEHTGENVEVWIAVTQPGTQSFAIILAGLGFSLAMIGPGA